jgi:sideroflexin-5
VWSRHPDELFHFPHTGRFNFANRNASKPFDAWGLGASYAIATSTAIGMAYSLGKVVDRVKSRFPVEAGRRMPFSVLLLSRTLPWVAVASAGAANALAMRYSEAVDGITVFDENGTAHGTSRQAGISCLTQVAITRVVSL